MAVDPTDLAAVAGLIRAGRVAALGTLRAGAPFVSMAAYAEEPDLCGVLLHLSRLAAHTANALADPRVSLLICEPERPGEDVQTLARITLIGELRPLDRDGAAYQAARSTYLAKLPAAAPLFDFPDFGLYRVAVTEGRYVGGFARAATLSAADLRAAAELP